MHSYHPMKIYPGSSVSQFAFLFLLDIYSVKYLSQQSNLQFEIELFIACRKYLLFINKF